MDNQIVEEVSLIESLQENKENSLCEMKDQINERMESLKMCYNEILLMRLNLAKAKVAYLKISKILDHMTGEMYDKPKETKEN